MELKIRKRMLPDGWYPSAKNEIDKIFSKWYADAEQRNRALAKEFDLQNKEVVSAVVPHAGWMFSGKIAFSTFSFLEKDADCIVVAGGHLGVNDKILAAGEHQFATPLGNINNNIELLDFIASKIDVYNDVYRDNTVEIHLPILKYFFPNAVMLWIRIPPDYKTVCSAAKAIYDYAQTKNKKIAVVGSTDLTHYGSSYNFAPHSTGNAAVQWVKNINDKEFIENILSYKTDDAIKHSLKNLSACSSGAAALACEYAKISGCETGRLLDYYTSFDVMPAESFVGYAGIVFCCNAI